MFLLFTKTYSRDYALAEYQMRLIRKFWARNTEMHHVYVVDDTAGLDQLTEVANKLSTPWYDIRVKIVTAEAKSIQDGYLQQQYVKLTWDKYSSMSDTCLQIDADMMPIAPWQPRGRDHAPWLYFPQEAWWITGERDIASRWRGVAERMLPAWVKDLPRDRGYMAGYGWFLQRDYMEDLRADVCSGVPLGLLHAMHRFTKTREPFSEYTLYGLWLAKYAPESLIPYDEAKAAGHPFPTLVCVPPPRQELGPKTWAVSPEIAHLLEGA